MGELKNKLETGIDFIKNGVITSPVTTITDIYGTLKEMVTGKKDTRRESEYIQHFSASKEYAMQPKHSKYSKMEKVVFAAILGILLHITILAIRYLYTFVHLQQTVLSTNILYLLLASLMPYAAWVVSTNENFWAFHKRKRLFFGLCTINLCFTVYQPIYKLVMRLAGAITGLFPLNPLFTKPMADMIGYVIAIICMGIVISLVYITFAPIITSVELKRKIETFKLQHIVDDRENREYKYDIKSIRSLETGKPITIKEKDRTLQGEINGVSGTGKTSTIFGNVIKDDLDQKLKNRQKRQEALLEMIEKGNAYIEGPLREFTELAIKPAGKNKAEKDKNQKEIDKIRKKYPDCGMTIVAPNASVAEDIIRLCRVRDTKVNVLDPVNNFEKYENVKTVSINPFYLPLNLPEDKRVIHISEASTVFSDVLIATNQMGGESDVYFTDISLSVSSNISAIVMLAKNIEGKQAYIDDVQDCINNFENLKPYVETIEKAFGITVAASSNASVKDGKVDVEKIQSMYMDKNVPLAQKMAARKNPYYYQILFVKQELLGAGSEAMFSQARGLRNLLNKICDTRIKSKLSAENDNRLDFDKILYNNEITVVNTAIELGKNISTSFGLFFLLLHRASVLRRPVDTRTMHALWVDECAQYVHPFFDDVIALYRQYNVPAFLTLQTLTQLEKNRSTAYLKNVFLGAGTHIVFGRLAPEEMKLYSAMSGARDEIVEQKTVSESSIWDTNPSYSESVRTTPEMKQELEGAQMRMLDFLELTVITVDSGRVLPAQHAKVSFVGKEAYDERDLDIVQWEKVAPEAFRFDETEEEADTEPETGEEYTEEKPNTSREEQPLRDRVEEESAKTILTQSTPIREAVETSKDREQQKEIPKEDAQMDLLTLFTLASTEKQMPDEEDEDEEFDYSQAAKQFNNL